MKNVITLIVLFCATSIAYANTLEDINRRYANTKISIIVQCATEATNLEEVAVYRDRGVRLEQILDSLFSTYARLRKVGTPVSDTDMMFEALLIVTLYTNMGVSRERIFVEYNDNCNNNMTKMLDYIYAIELKNLTDHN